MNNKEKISVNQFKLLLWLKIKKKNQKTPAKIKVIARRYFLPYLLSKGIASAAVKKFASAK